MTLWRLDSRLLLAVGTMVMFSSQSKVDFHVGVLVPYIYYGDFYGFKTAIDFAVETINNSSVLQGSKLVIHYKDTNVSGLRKI